MTSYEDESANRTTTTTTTGQPQAEMDDNGLTEPLIVPSETTTNDDSASLSLRGLWLYRALYFLNGLSASTWGRFGVVFYHLAGLSPLQIGILQGMGPLLSFFAIPLWGLLADWIQSRKQVYLLTNTCGSMALLSLSVLPHNFGWILACVSLMSLFRSSGVLDAFCLDYLGETHRGMYGTIRLWTSISWGLGALIMGYMTDAFGFEGNFCLYGIMMALKLLAVTFGLPARSKSEQARHEERIRRSNDNQTTTTIGEEPSSNRPDLAILFQALFQYPVLIWLLEVSIVGCGMAIVESFLFVYLEQDLEASTKLCGATVAVTVIFELPIFHYSNQLLEHMGHDALFTTALIAYILRVFGYTYLTTGTVDWVLALEALHGVTFACMWIASIDFSSAAAPAEWSTTFQTLLSACFGCFGYVVGGIAGGWVMQTYSANVLFRGIGWVVTGVLTLHVGLWLGLGHGHDTFVKKRQQQELQTVESNNDDDPVDDIVPTMTVQTDSEEDDGDDANELASMFDRNDPT